MTDSTGLSRADRIMSWLEDAMCRFTRRYLVKPAPIAELERPVDNEVGSSQARRSA